LLLVKKLPDWLQGFVRFAMLGIPFLPQESRL
jgi:hypothetical protein